MKQPVAIITGPDGLIRFIFSGNLLQEDLSFFKSGLDIGKTVIVNAFKQSGKKVKIILDMTNFSGKYVSDAIELLADFAKHNVDYVEKTASFGGSDSVKAAGEIVTAIAHRDNIQIFKTEAEALTWLN
jgi:hypothetical protein